jgi:hypothetical protein
MSSCHFCKNSIASDLSIGHQSVCSFCGRPLKVCLNCRFYDSAAYHQCLENIEEPVVHKDLANFCEYFVLKLTDSEQKKSNEEARNKFFALFNDEKE